MKLSLPGWILAIASAYFIAAYLAIACMTIGYPFQMEWLEGAVMEGVQRAFNGLPIYTPPSLRYAPLIYTPLYYYVAAAFAHLFGLTLLAGRIVSCAATLGTAALLYAWARREGAGKWFAAAAAALFFSTYAIVDQWFNQAHVDSLFLMLTLAGFFVYHFYRSAFASILSGILLALAFFTKQQALPILLPPMLIGLALWPRKTLLSFGTFALLGAAAIALCQRHSGGWFIFYTFQLPGTHPRDWHKLEPFLTQDMLMMPIALFLSACWLAWLLADDWRKALFYLSLLAGMIGASCASRIHLGGWNNVLMPAYTALCLTSVLAADYAIRRQKFRKNTCYVLLALQMLLIGYNPWAMIPHPENYAAGRKQMDYIRALPGEVFIPDMQFVQEQAGKQSYSYRIGNYDIVRANVDEQIKLDAYEQMQKAIREQKFAAIIVYDPKQLPEKNAYYRLKETILEPDATYLLSGFADTPNYVYVPVNRAPTP